MDRFESPYKLAGILGGIATGVLAIVGIVNLVHDPDPPPPTTTTTAPSPTTTTPTPSTTLDLPLPVRIAEEFTDIGDCRGFVNVLTPDRLVGGEKARGGGLSFFPGASGSGTACQAVLLSERFSNVRFEAGIVDDTAETDSEMSLEALDGDRVLRRATVKVGKRTSMAVPTAGVAQLRLQVRCVVGCGTGTVVAVAVIDPIGIPKPA